MSEKLMQPQSAEFQQPQTAQESYRERLRRGLREAGSAAYSILDVSAGIALNRDDIKRNEATMDRLNKRYDGMLERQSQTDAASMALEHDIVIAFRGEMQRAGMARDEMPAERRRQLAEATVATYLEEITAELGEHHSEWTVEEIAAVAAQRARDIVAIISMDSEQQDLYSAAMFEYIEARGEVVDLQQENAELKEERRERLGRMGGVAVKALFGFGSRLRNIPHAMSAKATIAGMDAAKGVREWYGRKSPEDKRTVLFSAASVAVAGIAAFVAVRLNGGQSGGNFVLASNETPINGQPLDVTTRIGGENGPLDVARIGGESGPLDVTRIGGEEGKPLDVTRIGGESDPLDVTRIGGESGPLDVTRIGSESGAADLSGVKTTEGLFGDKPVTKWPDMVKVSEWDSQTKDGSLWGIGTEMLERSGVKNPSDNQVQELVDALKPQAGNNGLLQNGQMLDLRPAIELLPKAK